MADNVVKTGAVALNRPEQIFKSNVFWRTFLSIFVITAVTVVIALAISAARYEREVTNQIQKSHDLLAGRMAKEMGQFFENTIAQINMVSDIADGLHTKGRDMVILLNRLAIHTPFITELTVYNRNLEAVASTITFPQEKLASNPALIKEAVAKNINISHIYFTETGVPMITIYVPTHGVENAGGAIVAEVSLKKLWWWIDEINKIPNITLFVINPADGMIVADQTKSSIRRSFPGWNGTKMKGGFTIENGEKVFTSVHKTPTVELTLILKTRIDPFVKHLYDMRFQLIGLALGVIVVASGFGAFLAWRSADSILRMVEAMDQYAQNPGNSRMTTDLPQEFQKMSDAFNKMLNSVEDHQVSRIRQESILKVGQLASILAHEVRHGLHVMLNIIFMIDSVSSETKNSVNRLVHDLVGKISDIMEFSRAGNISPEQVSADYITFQAAETVRYSKIALGKQINVSHRRGVAAPELFADRTKTVAALANMVRNSIESGAQTVHLSWEIVRENVIDFRVVDDGHGIIPESLETLFEPFHSSKRKGFGIGLSMADMVARAHGGMAYLVNSEPTGVEVRMILPMNGIPIPKDDLPPHMPPHLDPKLKKKDNGK